MTMTPLISVVVCTLNRAAILRVALTSLAAQTLDPAKFEVIVVDNGSTDETPDVVAACPANFRYVRELNPGLSNARNRGWQEAKGEFVAYTDDDCRLPPGWLEAARATIEELSPGIFGGPYFAFYNTPKPAWFKDAYESHDQGGERRPLGPHEYLDGGNLFLRRALLAELGGFDPQLGMVGGRKAYGEETALQRHLRAKHPEELIWYVPSLFVYHLVRPDKMKLWHVAVSRFARGRDTHFVWSGAPSPPLVFIRTTLHAMTAFGREIFDGLFFRDRTQHPHFQNHLYERAFLHIGTLGRLWAQCCQRAGLSR